MVDLVMSSMSYEIEQLRKQLAEANELRQKAEDENNAIKLLLRPLLLELKICGWEEDYTTFMLGDMAGNGRVDQVEPTISELAGIYTLYSGKLEDLVFAMADIIDPKNGKARSTESLAKAMKICKDYIMGNRKDIEELQEILRLEIQQKNEE